MIARGIRNNNPGNIRHGVNWVGDEPDGVRGDRDFERFDTMAHGLRALLKILHTYRHRWGLTTLREIISRWAPESENDTLAYIRSVAGALGYAMDDELPDAPAVYEQIARQIARHENGRDALLIPEADWAEAVQMAFGSEAPYDTTDRVRFENWWARVGGNHRTDPAGAAWAAWQAAQSKPKKEIV